MSEAGLASNGGFATAVAAATYAISSMGGEGEKKGALGKNKPVNDLQVTSTKTKSKKNTTTEKPTGSTTVLRWFSGTDQENDDDGSGRKFASFGDPDGPMQASLMKTKTKSKQENSNGKDTDAGGISRWFSRWEEKEDKEPDGTSTATEKARSAVDEKKPSGEIVMVPSTKKTPTFMDKHENDTGSNKFASEKAKATGPNASAPATTRSSFAGDRKSYFTSNQEETKADVWEKAKLAKIQRRHDKQYARILEWESEKKKRAKSRSDRIEEKLELRRAIASQELWNEIARIDKIVARARVAADEKRRSKERKTMEKANEIRATGKIPHECSCI